ncbi:hypothetical protein MTsPCn5_29760 [Croceitalea sp. MTPC5]|uniref:hypothetical protein n=1 Tax=Croceitalea sp. MTPC5 TaxID=3056565 RepID=UPI002B3B051D|nr:hypothetical protein MTsPCn5_29760 [Croceitalea sp. MTPC5]
MNKNNIKYFLGATLLTAMLFTGCDDGDQIVDQITENVQRGAVLRTVDLVSNELPIGEADGNFSVDLEVQDIENGTLVQDVEVYIGFRDNTDEFGPGTDVDEALVETISSSTFTIGEFGLPRFSYTVTLPELLSIVGRNESDITGGDQFTVRFELVLVDGRRFSFADNSGTLTGSFFSSPFLYTPTVVCPIPEGAFTGTYTSVQNTPGIFGATVRDAEAELTATSNTARSATVNLYPQFNGGAGFDNSLAFDLVCDQISFIPLDTGLACAGAPTITYAPSSTITMYDPEDDSMFTLVFDVDGGTCGGSAEVSVTFTRVD